LPLFTQRRGRGVLRSSPRNGVLRSSSRQPCAGCPDVSPRPLPSSSARSFARSRPASTCVSSTPSSPWGPSLRFTSAGRPRCPQRPPSPLRWAHHSPAPGPWPGHQDFIGHLRDALVLAHGALSSLRKPFAWGECITQAGSSAPNGPRSRAACSSECGLYRWAVASRRHRRVRSPSTMGPWAT
jgi:hypothetical protein